jgi:phytanoyl-CoA hydroxylase
VETPALSGIQHAPGQTPTRGFSSEEREQFACDGFCIARQLVPPALCERMLEVARDGLAREIAPVEYEADLHYPGAPSSRESAGGRTVRRLQQALTRDACFTEWICSAGLADRLRQILGPRVVMPLAHHNCIMTKQPRYSSDTGWHQDIRYWAFARPDLVSVWLALTPENIRNGCLHLISGTHRMEIERHQYDEASFLREDLPENRALIARSVPAELQPGDVLFFHCLAFHAASRNHTEATKYSVVFTFRSADNPPLPNTRSASLPELLLPLMSGNA